MSRREVRSRPAWRVRIPAHSVERGTVDGRATGRVYEIPERVVVRFEESSEAAVRFVVVAAHRDAGVPPWGPYFRQTTRLATVEACTWHPETASAA